MGVIRSAVGNVWWSGRCWLTHGVGTSECGVSAAKVRSSHTPKHKTGEGARRTRTRTAFGVWNEVWLSGLSRRLFLACD